MLAAIVSSSPRWVADLERALPIHIAPLLAHGALFALYGVEDRPLFPRPFGVVAFPADEAKRIADRFEIHYTPKHGSWLDMAEIELGILGRQCLDRRIDNTEALTREVAAWETQRNAAEAKVNWRFTTDDARIRLKKLYPSFDV